MAEIRLKSMGDKGWGLRIDGCSAEIGGGVRVEFKEVINGREKETLYLHLTPIEAIDIMRGTALFFGYDFVKKEGVQDGKD